MASVQGVMRWLVPALTLFISACNPCTRSDHTPKMTEAEAINIANAVAREQGVDLSKWQQPVAHFDYVEHDCTWSVFYEIIGNAMPGHFLVVVNDNTKRAYLSGGM